MAEVVKTREFHVLNTPKPLLEQSEANANSIRKTIQDMKDQLQEVELAIWAKPKQIDAKDRETLVQKILKPCDFSFKSPHSDDGLKLRKKKVLEADVYYDIRTKESTAARFYLPESDSRFRKAFWTESDLKLLKQRPHTVPSFTERPGSPFRAVLPEKTLKKLESRGLVPGKLQSQSSKELPTQQMTSSQLPTAREIMRTCRNATDPRQAIEPGQHTGTPKRSRKDMTKTGYSWEIDPETLRRRNREQIFKSLKTVDSGQLKLLQKELSKPGSSQKNNQGVPGPSGLQVKVPKKTVEVGVSIDPSLERFNQVHKKTGVLLELMANTNDRKLVQDFTMTQGKPRPLWGSHTVAVDASDHRRKMSYCERPKGLVSAYSELTSVYKYNRSLNAAELSVESEGLVRPLSSVAKYHPETEEPKSGQKTIQKTKSLKAKAFFNPTDVPSGQSTEAKLDAEKLSRQFSGHSTFRSTKTLQDLKFDVSGGKEAGAILTNRHLKPSTTFQTSADEQTIFTSSPASAYIRRLSQTQTISFEKKPENKSETVDDITEQASSKQRTRNLLKKTQTLPATQKQPESRHLFPMPHASLQSSRNSGIPIISALHSDHRQKDSSLSREGSTLSIATFRRGSSTNAPHNIKGPSLLSSRVSQGASSKSFAPFRRDSSHDMYTNGHTPKTEAATRHSYSSRHGSLSKPLLSIQWNAESVTSEDPRLESGNDGSGGISPFFGGSVATYEDITDANRYPDEDTKNNLEPSQEKETATSNSKNQAKKVAFEGALRAT